MMDHRRWWALFPRQVRNLPADLAAVALVTLATALVATVPVLDETPLRIAFGLPYLLFLPGYALVAALFPEAGPDREARTGGEERSDADDGWGTDTERGAPDESATRTAGVDDAGIDGIERVALSFATSVAVVPLVVLGLNFTPWGIRLTPILAGVSAVTLGCTAVAAHRRWALPPGQRFRVPYRRWVGGTHAALFRPATRTDAALNVLLAVSVLVATASVGFAVTVPKEGESFSEFYLLTEGDDGELVADGFPTEFVRGESRPLVVGVDNGEHEPTSYTVVVALQDVAVVDNRTEVRETEELDRFGARLSHNESWDTEYEVTPTMTGTGLRLQFLLYEGDAPADPRVENSYRDLHLWINVTDGSGRETSPAA